jgi:tetratricopeptide (TPR) repeat protein
MMVTSATGKDLPVSTPGGSLLQCFNCGLQQDAPRPAPVGHRGLPCRSCGSAVTQIIAFDKAAQYRQAQNIGQEGESLYNDDRFEQAIAKFQAALQLAPDDPILLLDMGNALGMIGWNKRDRRTLEESIEYLTKALELFPDYERAQRNLEVTKAKLATLKSAETPAAPAPQVASASQAEIDAAVQQGVEHLRTGRVDEAIQRFSWVLTQMGNHFQAQQYLGIAYGTKGDITRAVTHLKFAIDLNANVPQTHFNLGVLYQKQGNIADAIRELEAALRLNPNYTQAQQALTQLRGHGQAR